MKIIYKGTEVLKGIINQLEIRKLKDLLKGKGLQGYIRRGDLIIEERSSVDEEKE